VCETGCEVCVSYCWPGIDSQHHLPLQEAQTRSRIASRGALVLAVALGDGDGGRVLLGSHVHGHDRCGYGRTLSGSTVTFDQAADTFFADVEFSAEQDRLTGEGDFGDESIRLVLTRSE
jgi:hypothetical protein